MTAFGSDDVRAPSGASNCAGTIGHLAAALDQGARVLVVQHSLRLQPADVAAALAEAACGLLDDRARIDRECRRRAKLERLAGLARQLARAIDGPEGLEALARAGLDPGFAVHADALAEAVPRGRQRRGRRRDDGKRAFIQALADLWTRGTGRPAPRGADETSPAIAFAVDACAAIAREVDLEYRGMFKMSPKRWRTGRRHAL